MQCQLCDNYYLTAICPRCGLDSGDNPQVTPLNFGKHKGYTIDQVFTISPSYLEWMIKQKAGTPAQRAKAKLLLSGFANPHPDWQSTTLYNMPRRYEGVVHLPNSKLPDDIIDIVPRPISKKNNDLMRTVAWCLIGGAGAIIVLCLVILLASNNKSNSQQSSSSRIVPNTATPYVAPTAISQPVSSNSSRLFIVEASGFAIVGSGVSVYDSPNPDRKIIEYTGFSNGVVEWQSKTSDGIWYERKGGGWINYFDVIQCPSKEKALAALQGKTLSLNCETDNQEVIPPPQIPTAAPPVAKEFILSANGELTYPTSQCQIKGNVEFNTKELIYHVPGGRYYAATVIDPRYGERWFCTEQDAVNNGWRKSTQ